MNQSGTPNDIGSILVALIAERGNALLENRRRLFGLLRDRAPGSLRESRILMMAYDDGLPGRLRAAPVSDIEVAREAAQFSNNTGVSAEFARGAVIAWARALTGYQPAAVAAPPAAPLALPAQPVQPVYVQPVPVQPVYVEPVQPLPAQTVQPIPQPQASGVAALPPAAAPNADLKKWIGIAAVVVAAMAGVSMMSDTFSSKPEPQAPQQPQQQPRPQPQQQPQPQRPQNAPQNPGVTPENVAVLTPRTPYPIYKIDRIQNDPNSLVVDFGASTPSGPITYRAAILFKRGSTQGLSRLIALRNGKTTQVDNPAVRKQDNQNRNHSVVIGGGGMAANEIGAPGLCIVILHMANRTDRLDLTNDATVCALAAPGPNGKACGEAVGCGTLR